MMSTRLLTLSCVILLAISAGFVNRLRAQARNEGALSLTDNRVVRGFAIAPVPLNLQGKSAALVGLGSYIVNAAGGCNDCHTNPPYASGGDPFLGQPKQVNSADYLAGGMAFGPFVSRNLTPRQNGLPAGLTRHQFFQEMRTGVDLKKIPPHVPSEENDLLQVMPWPVYQDLTDTDLAAIYEYLRAIPPAQPGS
jgi:hypothetical protein